MRQRARPRAAAARGARNAEQQTLIELKGEPRRGRRGAWRSSSGSSIILIFRNSSTRSRVHGIRTEADPGTRPSPMRHRNRRLVIIKCNPIFFMRYGPCQFPHPEIPDEPRKVGGQSPPKPSASPFQFVSACFHTLQEQHYHRRQRRDHDP